MSGYNLGLGATDADVERAFGGEEGGATCLCCGDVFEPFNDDERCGKCEDFEYWIPYEGLNKFWALSMFRQLIEDARVNNIVPPEELEALEEAERFLAWNTKEVKS